MHTKTPRIKQPKTHRGRLFLDNRSSKIEENDKTTLFLYGSKLSSTIKDVLKDIASLKQPLCHSLKNLITERPFEETDLIISQCKKYDCSLWIRASHSKKRPNCLTMGRLFNFEVLDMYEILVSDFQSILSFPSDKILDCAKSVLIFNGPEFDVHGSLFHFRNFLVDFFRGPKVTRVLASSIEHVLQFIQIDNQTIQIRSYRIVLPTSTIINSSLLSRIEDLQEIGPRMTWKIGRSVLPKPDLWKRAIFVPVEIVKQSKQEKKNRQVSMDEFGNKKARLFLNPQDIDKAGFKNMRALKRSRDEIQEGSDSDDNGSAGSADEEGPISKMPKAIEA